MKRFIALVSVLALIVAMCVTVSAAEVRSARPTLALSFNGTTAVCTATITSPNDSISATMVLKQGNTVIGRWTDTDTSVVYLKGERSVTKGVTYCLELTGTANGIPFSLTKTGKC